MTKWRVVGLLALLVFALACPNAKADTVVLTFEGLADSEPIDNFYNGGLGGFGSGPGPNDGVVFTPDSLAVITRDAGGSGNFSGNPSGVTIAFFLIGSGDTMDIAAGFDTGFSFFYSGAFDGSVNVYSGLDGTGTLLASLVLPTNFQNRPCSGAGPFCTWDPIGVTFSGIAESAVFSGTANEIGFDDITLGSATAGGGSVPEPGSLSLLALGLVGVGALRRKNLAALLA